MRSAPKYRIQYSTNANLSKATYVRVVGNAYDLTKLRPNTRYYFRVRVITASGGNVSDYSRTFSARTAKSSGYSYLAPRNLRVTAKTSSTVSVKWDSRGSGIRYRIEYSTSSSRANPVYKRYTPNEATLTGLKPGSAYYFRVRVISNDGASLSGYSELVRGDTAKSSENSSVSSRPSGTTGTTKGAALRVGSYNVKCANCFSKLTDELPWNDRRDAVVANLRSQNLDVMGIQEASQGWLRDDNGKTLDLSQFEDLQQRLGSSYALTNDKRNNCVKSKTPTNCVYADQGASKGTKIIYNSARVSLVQEGSRRLSSLKNENNERYVAWAILQQKSSGKKFFFASTHLENEADKDGSTANYELRRTQAREIAREIAAHNSQRLPVVSVGDFNSTKFASPSNGSYDEMLKSGLVDPLGNAYRSTKVAPNATVEKRINTHYDSFNGYQRSLKTRSNWINGSYMDYIFTTPMRVSEYENVVDVNARDEFNGIIPADHNLQRATVHLP